MILRVVKPVNVPPRQTTRVVEKKEGRFNITEQFKQNAERVAHSRAKLTGLAYYAPVDLLFNMPLRVWM